MRTNVLGVLLVLSPVWISTTRKRRRTLYLCASMRKRFFRVDWCAMRPAAVCTVQLPPAWKRVRCRYLNEQRTGLSSLPTGSGASAAKSVQLPARSMFPDLMRKTRWSNVTAVLSGLPAGWNRPVSVSATPVHSSWCRKKKRFQELYSGPGRWIYRGVDD